MRHPYVIAMRRDIGQLIVAHMSVLIASPREVTLEQALLNSKVSHVIDGCEAHTRRRRMHVR